ncbi:hypothetical protein QWJ34_20875 [Saccharibacillus sp. CPCC 101409]|uniref:hypothetical protein n=1 Tax=Saccharibacillus sp. CPCC 101409 TaxID=3058041 RepID=UPI0026718CD1|nr:hypothetical protein [Saccharibacillus sp. CPCC 101409]MDO3412230.1 hypothetical protein [Saccharibacillus sp. CPCC 101409]
MKDYFPVGFHIDGRLHWCIWYMDDKDGFLVEGGRLKQMESEEALGTYFRSNGWAYKDRDICMVWADQLREEFKRIQETRTVDCACFLNFWNMVGDIAHTLTFDFYGDKDEVTPTYDKVFYGTNPEVLRGDGEWYTPAWDDEELEELEDVFRDGLKVLRAGL